MGRVIARFHRTAKENGALVVHRLTGLDVVFQGGTFVLPVLDRVDVMDLSSKALDIELSRKTGLICKDKLRADVRMTFEVGIKPTRESVIQVVQCIGCQRASDEVVLRALFESRFVKALESLAAELEFLELLNARHDFGRLLRPRIDLEFGYELRGIVVHDLEQTPLEHLDPKVDVEAIRALTQVRAQSELEARQRAKAEIQARAEDIERKRQAGEEIFGFFSDVHGDLEATRRALQVLKEADRIFFLGDVTGGRDTDGCLKALRASRAEAIPGNHDLWGFELDGVSATNRAWLESLPLDREAANFLAIHSYYLTRPRFIYIESEEDALRAWEQFGQRVLFVGHTHVNQVYQLDRAGGVTFFTARSRPEFTLEAESRYIINVGAAQEAVVWYDFPAQHVSFRFFDDC